MDAVALGVEIPDRLAVCGDDVRVLALRPLVLEKNMRARFEFAGRLAADQDLLVQRNDHVRGITRIGHGARTETDPIAACPLDAARRRLDLCRNDLDGPDTVAHLGRDGSEHLSGRLGSLTGVRNYLDDVVRDPLRPGTVHRDDVRRWMSGLG
jgi:hypothetical protein